MIEVLSLRRVDRGALKALAKARIGPVTIDGIRVLQQPGGRPWLGLPQAPTRRSGGGSGWAAIVRIDDPDVLADLGNAVITAWDSRDDGHRL